MMHLFLVLPSLVQSSKATVAIYNEVGWCGTEQYRVMIDDSTAGTACVPGAMGWSIGFNKDPAGFPLAVWPNIDCSGTGFTYAQGVCGALPNTDLQRDDPVRGHGLKLLSLSLNDTPLSLDSATQPINECPSVPEGCDAGAGIFCCYINEYSGWCGTTDQACSGHWKLEEEPILAVETALTLTSTLSLDSATQPINLCPSVPDGCDAGAGIFCCYINEYSGFCGTLDQDCSGHWKLQGKCDDATGSSLVTECAGGSLKNCLNAYPGCQSQCESVCPDKCSGCTCGSIDCNQWQCNACLPECGDCYGMTQCCPHSMVELTPPFMA